MARARRTRRSSRPATRKRGARTRRATSMPKRRTGRKLKMYGPALRIGFREAQRLASKIDHRKASRAAAWVNKQLDRVNPFKLWRARNRIAGLATIGALAGAGRIRTNGAGPSGSSTPAPTRWDIVPQRGPKRKRMSFGGARKRMRSGTRSYNSGAVMKIKKPRRPVRHSVYAANGVREVEEKYGTVTHTNCLYFGVGSAPHNTIGWQIGAAIMRWVLKTRLKRNIMSVWEPIILPVDSNYPQRHALTSIQFHYERKVNGTNTYFVQPFGNPATPITAVQTISSFADWFRTNCWNLGQDDTGRSDVLKYITYTTAVGSQGAAGQEVQDVIDVDSIVINLFVKQTIALQNVTPSDSGSLDADRLDLNPLKGRMFTCKGQAPVVKNAVHLWSTTDVDGYPSLEVNYNDGLLIPANNPIQGWRQPPSSDYFENVIKQKSIMMKPGDIQTYTTMFKYKGHYNNIYYGLNPKGFDSSDSRPNNVKAMYGKCYLIALEKILRTGTSADVICNYHIDREASCMVKTKRLVQTMNKVVRIPVAENVDPA